jgi:Raf kinase inhibitor-like YbhB/YbcL family protein
MAIGLTSAAFSPGSPIPKKHTGEGADTSPPLAWSDLPAGTKELALICDDPDAPTPKPWVHWVLYGLSASLAGLKEGDAGGGLSGPTDFGRPGYGGPMPPKGHGVHRYFFRLYALDAPLGAKSGLTKEKLLAAMKGHILGEAELMGTYIRK